MAYRRSSRYLKDVLLALWLLPVMLFVTYLFMLTE
jgi:hypothetical protein